MARICDIAQQALTTGCLTITAEDELRRLMQTKYDNEDFFAFMQLQHAAMEGKVKQESREQRRDRHAAIC
ncbi:hypothetical protein IQ268_15505 [Oculatella sp. LEGE 06141]|uniref:hypothetical protein n=1 Tax=Oculatella sp. LEGE 06141 TaxID=1828648 RepID=UPI00187F280C|nr:hypothetical protein [Oculatella sp. LEGE 06141]MBE9179975.1 hypothetical protein [Oculatella sp. LEGE 06141]